MANFEIDEEVLVAFLKGELDAAQAAAVEAWYDRSAANRRMLGQVYYILYVSDRIKTRPVSTSSVRSGSSSAACTPDAVSPCAGARCV